MMGNNQDLKSWIPTILQIILSLVFGGGIIWLFSEFKEYLPALLYSVVLYVVAIVLVLSLVVFVARVMFGDLIGRLYKWASDCRKKSRRCKLARDWNKHWLELTDLLDVIWNSDTSPSQKQEDDFLRLHFWFLAHRNQFLPSWSHFMRVRPSGIFDWHDVRDSKSLSHYVLVEHEDDPFSVFYQPLNFRGVSYIVKVLRVGDDEWKIDGDAASTARFVLRILSELMVEYVSWVE